MKMKFGKFKGYDIEDIPDSYLLWLHFQTDFLNDNVLENTENEICRRWPGRVPVKFVDLSPYQESETVDSKKLQKVYRTLAMKYHPDKGGDLVAMQAINLFYEMLKAA